MYEAVYDQKHRFRIIYTGAEYKERWAQKGLREPLLCEICEGQISSYERYVSLIFSGAINTTAERERQFQKISGLDYSQFKLFALSVLWRASATDLPFFSNVNLGKYQEFARKLLAAGDPGRQTQFPILIGGVTLNGEPLNGAILEPTRSKVDGHFCYRFLFGGLIWVFIVSGHTVSPTLSHAILRESGTFRMLVQDVREISFIADQIQKLQNNWASKSAT